MRLAIITSAFLAICATSGCINWQTGYDEAARRECRSEVDTGDRSACIDRADRNASERRAERSR